MLYDTDTYTVYMHRNKINGKVYIGITSRQPKERWSGGNGYYRNQHFHRAILKYGWDNFEHIILATGLDKGMATQMERRLIKEYDSTNQDKGYNYGLGGQGVGTCSEQTRQKIRQAHIGMKYSEQTRAKVSAAHKGQKNWCYGRRLPEWHVERLRQSRLGKPLTDEQKDNLTEKTGHRTNQYDLAGKYITTYRSTGEAAKILGISKSGVKACCQKRINSDHGFIFRYEEQGYPRCIDLSEQEIRSLNYNKEIHKILQCDKQWNVISEFANFKMAESITHIDRHRISKCVHGQIELAGGYRWKFSHNG